jgi:hypothetical protein
MSNGRHYQIADHNPIVAVYTTESAAVEVVRNIIQKRIESSDGKLHSKIGEIDSEVVYRLGAFDSIGNCSVSYSVIKQGMML